MSCDASNSPLKAAPQALDTWVSQVIVNPLCVELLVNAPVEPDCTPSKVELVKPDVVVPALGNMFVVNAVSFSSANPTELANILKPQYNKIPDNKIISHLIK
jgi:hypothetical protein